MIIFQPRDIGCMRNREHIEPNKMHLFTNQDMLIRYLTQLNFVEITIENNENHRLVVKQGGFVIGWLYSVINKTEENYGE